MGNRDKNLIGNPGISKAAWRQDGTTVLFIETLALLAIFIIVTVILVNGFLFAGKLSKDAESLSKAVHLAENTAEMVSASKSGEMLFSLLNENGNASVLEQGGGVYRAMYDADMNPAADGIFYADVSWAPEQNSLVRSTVNIYRKDGAEPIYSLDLAVYIND